MCLPYFASFSPSVNWLPDIKNQKCYGKTKDVSTSVYYLNVMAMYFYFHTVSIQVFSPVIYLNKYSDLAKQDGH